MSRAPGIRTSGDSRDAYEAWHSSLRQVESQDEPDLYPWHRNALELLGSIRGLDVLEVACGRGDFARRLADERPRSIVAVDFSRVAADAARERAARAGLRILCVAGDAQNLPLSTASFDVVVSCETMEHVFEPDQMAREIARVLRPHGRYVLTAPNYFNGLFLAHVHSWITGKPVESGTRVQPVEHCLFWWKVRAILSRAGLTVDRMTSTHFQWLLLPRTDPARLRTDNFSSRWLQRLCMPFGVHFAYAGHRRRAVS